MHLNRISSFIFSGDAVTTINEKGTNITKTADKRETLILAIDFLDSILIPYVDKKLIVYRLKFLDRIKECELRLILDSINDKAYKLAEKSDNFYKGYEYWRFKLKKDRLVSIEKGSGCYEFYLCKKFSYYMKYFQKLNKLLFRKKWLVVSDYTEGEEDE